MPAKKAPATRNRRQPAPGYVPVKLFEGEWLLMQPFYDEASGALSRLDYVPNEEGPDPLAPRVWRRRADAVRDSHTDYLRRQNDLLKAELQRRQVQTDTRTVSETMLSAVS